MSLGSGVGVELGGDLGVVAEHVDAAGEVFAGGGAIDPGDGVLDVGVAGLDVEELVDAVELDSLVVDHAGDDGFEASWAQVMRPVRPMPPMVAAYQSGFSVGVQRRRVPSERTSSKAGTWQAKEPACSWFLPWMSLAMAPPRVTYLVPGVTGRKKPRGTAKSRIWARVMPDSAVRRPVCGVERDEAVHAGGLEEVAAFEEADVSVGAAHADGEGAVGEVGGDAGEVGLPGEGDEVGLVLGEAAPGFEVSGGFGGGFASGGRWHRSLGYAMGFRRWSLGGLGLGTFGKALFEVEEGLLDETEA